MKKFNFNYKKALIIGASVLGVFILLTTSLLIYLHHARFQVVFNQLPMKAYFKNDIGSIIHIQGERVTIKIPNDVINTMFSERIKGLQLSEKERIQDGYVNTAEGKAYVNMMIRGIYVPIAMEVEFKTTDRTISLAFKNMKLRDKKLLTLPNGLEKKLLDKLAGQASQFGVSLDDYQIPPIMSVDEVNFKTDQVDVVLKVNQEIFVKQMKDISMIRSKELYGIYQNKEGTQKRAITIMDQRDQLTTAHTEEILKDLFFGKQELIKQLLIVTDEKNMDMVFDDYGHYIKGFQKEDIIKEKNKLILGKIETYCTALREAVEGLSKEEYIVFGNYPYALGDRKLLNVEDMIEKAQLDIPEDVYQKMDLRFNYDKKAFMIAYEVDGAYALVGKDDYDFVDSQVYGAYAYDEPKDNQVTYDTAIEEQIAAYFTTDVFIRYMNTDGQYAFVIASAATHYQDYERFALEKENDVWRIVETGISDLYAFSVAHPGFNLKTITDHDMNDKIYALSKEDIAVLVDQLAFRKMIPDKKSVTLTYCSYDGKYIALKLSNDEEYVFSIKYAYLDKVYTKDVAVTKWKDISPLILLQDNDKEEEKETSEEQQGASEQQDSNEE